MASKNLTTELQGGEHLERDSVSKNDAVGVTLSMTKTNVLGQQNNAAVELLLYWLYHHTMQVMLSMLKAR